MTAQGEYYIERDRQQLGPYDLLSMIRKIRSGQVTQQTVIYIVGEETPMAAAQIPVFMEVFSEVSTEANRTVEDEKAALGVKALFKNGLDVLLHNLVLFVYTGILLLALILNAAIIAALTGSATFTAIAGGILGYFFYTLYQMVVLRKVRMQLITVGYLLSLVRRAGAQLLFFSTVAGGITFVLPMLLVQVVGPAALALILLPGSFVLLALFYAPVFIADRGMGAMEGLRASFGALRALGSDNFIALYLLMLGNFIAAVALFFPLVITLPLTVAALCEVYDDHLNQYGIS